MLSQYVCPSSIAVGASLRDVPHCRFGWMITSAVALCMTAQALAQCEPTWLPAITSDAYSPGAGTTIMTTWDPDGSGPLAERLVLGGSISGAGDAVTEGIAVFDGLAWSGLPKVLGRAVSGVGNDRGTLVAFSSISNDSNGSPYRWNGSAWELMQPLNVGRAVGFSVVDNQFWCAGDSRVLRWDGTSWNDEGRAVRNFQAPAQIVSYKGAIYAIGNVGGESQGVFTTGVAVKQGNKWLPVGGAVRSDFDITAVTVWRDEIVLIGSVWVPEGKLSGLLAFNGTTWRVLDPTHTFASSLIVHRGDLVALGTFRPEDGPARYIARFDGTSWHPMGAGLSSAGSRLGLDPNGDLIVSGRFAKAGDMPARGLARWDGSEWHTYFKGFDGPIKAVATNGGDMYVGGEFTLAQDVATSGVAKYDGHAWSALGPSGPENVRSLLWRDGKLYAAGAGGTRIGVWDGTTWTTLGDGTVEGRALVEYQGNILVSGSFPIANSSDYAQIARVDGVALVPFAAGLNGDVNAMAVYRGELVVGGTFLGATTASGTTTLNRVARWTGNQWAAMKGGANGEVLGLTLFEDKLIIAGAFGIIGGPPFGGGIDVSGVAAWSGADYSALGAGLSAKTNAIHVHRGSLYATGAFNKAGSEFVYGLARWDGIKWVGVENGFRGPPEFGISLSKTGDGFALGTYNNALVVAGSFTTVGGDKPRSGIALYGSACLACVADFNGDGFVSFEDFDRFVEAIESGATSADINGDGFLTAEDFDAFVVAFEVGC